MMKVRLVTSLQVACLLFLTCEGNILPPKEHKVHNIVLYPDKHSWCKVTPIKQVISHAGCQAKSVDNNVCVGTCFSFSVPKTIPETPGDDQLHYCDSCQSSDSTWITVSLDCPEDTNHPKVEKSVEIIANCSCTSCKEKPRVMTISQVEDDQTDYDEDADNLKHHMYDIQQIALKHQARMGRKNAGLFATPPGHLSNNKHLDLLKEEEDESEVHNGETDSETFRQVRAQIGALKP